MLEFDTFAPSNIPVDPPKSRSFGYAQDDKFDMSTKCHEDLDAFASCMAGKRKTVILSVAEGSAFLSANHQN
jgi:hypothetical protein